VWRDGVMVRLSDSCLGGHEFNFESFHLQVTIFGKLFTGMPLSPSSTNWYWSHSCDGKVTAGMASNWLCVTNYSAVYQQKGSVMTELWFKISLNIKHFSGAFSRQSLGKN